MPNIGLNFSPTQGGNQYGQNGQRSGAPSSPVMDAIKILSFRVPQTLGANAPVAQSLIGGPGGNPGSGLDNSAMVMNWLNRFFGQGAQAHTPVPAWNPLGQDFNSGAMAPMGTASASPSGNGGDVGAGSSLPGATRPSVTFPASQFPTSAPPTPGPGAAAGGFNTPSPLGGDNPQF